MRKSTGIYLVLIMLVGISIAGCAKDVGEDNVPRIAVTIEITAETLTEEGLRILQDKAPGEVDSFVTDLRVIVAQAALYSDGVVSVGDVAASLSGLLERLNARLDLVDNDAAVVALRTIAKMARLAEAYFVSTEIPEEAVLYVNALSAGVQAGLSTFLAVKVVPAVQIEPVEVDE